MFKYGKWKPSVSGIVGKLEFAFSLGCNVKEACIYSDISRDTYYRWVNKNSKLRTHFEDLRMTPVILAKERICSGISESYANAVDYLKRVKPNEFGDKIASGSDGKVLITSESAWNKML